MASQQLNMSQSHAVVRRKFNIGITGCKTQNLLIYFTLYKSQLEYYTQIWQTLFKKDTNQMYGV